MVRSHAELTHEAERSGQALIEKFSNTLVLPHGHVILDTRFAEHYVSSKTYV